MLGAAFALCLAVQDDSAIDGALKYLKQELPKTEGGNQMVDYCYVGLAFLANGCSLTEGAYAAELKTCLDAVMQYKGQGFNENWYYAMAGLFLAEHYRKFPFEELKVKLEEIGKGMAKGQEPTGGWTHSKGHKYTHAFTKQPIPDICFLTSMMIAAIGAMKAAGIKVPDGMIYRALTNLAKNEDRDGGINYGTHNAVVDKGGTRGGGAVVGLHLLNSKGSQYAKYAKVVKDRVKGFDQGHAYSPLHFLYGGMALQLTSAWDTLKSTWLDKLAAQASSGGIKLPHREAIDMDKGTIMSTAVYAILLQLPKGQLFGKAQVFARSPFARKDDPEDPPKKDK